MKHVLGTLRGVEDLFGGFDQELFILHIFILEQVVDPKIKALSEVLINLLLLVLQMLQPQLELAFRV